MVNGITVLLLVLGALALVRAQETSLPMPPRVIPSDVDLSPGGRSSVHGWLWMPTMISGERAPNPQVLRGYWSHHTPEFWTNSPHDFQLLLHAEVALQTPLPQLPFAETNVTVGNEYTFTPPYDFSLNDMIEGRPLQLVGNFFNGSFDTTFERVKMSNAKFVGTVQSIAVVHYLNITSKDSVSALPYLSYPRVEAAPCASCDRLAKFDIYLAHLIHTAPDFDQIVHAHVNLTACEGATEDLLLAAQEVGATWTMDRSNVLDERLRSGERATATLVPEFRASSSLVCPVEVLEEMHCVVGPAFGPRCDGLPEAG